MYQAVFIDNRDALTEKQNYINITGKQTDQEQEGLLAGLQTKEISFQARNSLSAGRQACLEQTGSQTTREH